MHLSRNSSLFQYSSDGPRGQCFYYHLSHSTQESPALSWMLSFLKKRCKLNCQRERNHASFSLQSSICMSGHWLLKAQPGKGYSLKKADLRVSLKSCSSCSLKALQSPGAFHEELLNVRTFIGDLLKFGSLQVHFCIAVWFHVICFLPASYKVVKGLWCLHRAFTNHSRCCRNCCRASCSVLLRLCFSARLKSQIGPARSLARLDHLFDPPSRASVFYMAFEDSLQPILHYCFDPEVCAFPYQKWLRVTFWSTNLPPGKP